MRKAEIIIPIGIPACGKTTDRQDNYFVVCRDDIRAMLFNSRKTNVHFVARLENLIDKIEKMILIELCQRGNNIYLDATNGKKEKRKRVIDIAKAYNYSVKYRVYNNLQAAVMRNAKRKRVVPDNDMRHIIANFEFPMPEEIQQFNIENLEVIDT